MVSVGLLDARVLSGRGFIFHKNHFSNHDDRLDPVLLACFEETRILYSIRFERLALLARGGF
jgi:hypothetical protein